MISKSTNSDLKLYPVYGLTHRGELIPLPYITSTDDYNHQTHHIHHYIRQGAYAGNKNWYEKRGIKQKLILLPIFVHEQVHNQAIKNLTDEEFLRKYKISRWDLVFNRRYSKY